MERVLRISFPAFFILLLASCSNEFDGKDGIKTVYFPESDIVKQLVEYRDGKRVGELREFYRNGKLKVRQQYRNDTLTDSSFFYHENGNIQYFQYLKNNKKEGVWKRYNEQGKVYEESTYKDDLLNGPASRYTYRTGRLLDRYNYVNGNKEGKQELYHNNGKPKAILYFHRNHPCVGTEEFRENGEKINNDFKVTVIQNNKLLMMNRFQVIVKLSDPKPDDEVWVISPEDPDNYATKMYPMKKDGDAFIREYSIGGGGFIMESFKIAAYRKTALGNTAIKVVPITISANNY